MTIIQFINHFPKESPTKHFFLPKHIKNGLEFPPLSIYKANHVCVGCATQKRKSGGKMCQGETPNSSYKKGFLIQY